MTEIGAGKIIYDLRKKIQLVQFELNQIGAPVSDISELIDTANLLRSNESLLKINEKQSELILAFEQHSKALEELLTAVFDIQNNLKDILHAQSSLIPEPKSKPNSKPKSKK